MKTAAFFGLVLALSASAAPAGRSPPKPIQIGFWDAGHGIALFYGCYRCPLQVRTTQDGGRTWETIRSARADAGLVVARPDAAWVGRLATVDRGRSWTTLPRQKYQAISFADPRFGWGFYDDGREAANSARLAQTRSAGSSWTRVRNPCDRIRERLVDLSSPTRKAAWVLCSGLYGAGNDAKTIFHTVDGGRRWRMVNRIDFPGSGPIVGSGLGVNGYAAGIAMRATGSGWLWEGRGWAFWTSDGGRTWRKSRVTAAESREARSVALASRRVSFMLLQDYERREYRLLRTADAGARWQVVHKWRYR